MRHDLSGGREEKKTSERSRSAPARSCDPSPRSPEDAPVGYGPARGRLPSGSVLGAPPPARAPQRPLLPRPLAAEEPHIPRGAAGGCPAPCPAGGPGRSWASSRAPWAWNDRDARRRWKLRRD